MKRLAIILLCLLTITVIGGASAESNPITFRGIEWGSSLPVVLSKLPSEIKFYDLDSDSNYSVLDSMTEDHKNYYDGHVVGYTYARSSSLEGIRVAGYELSGLRLRFAWVPGDDGLIVEDADHTALFFAEYEIEPKDLNAAYTDLTTKLSSLYGDPVSTTSGGFVIDEKCTLWNGQNGTVLVLFSKEYSSGGKEIYIRYGTTEGDKWLQNAYDALILKETLETASNIDGL